MGKKSLKKNSKRGFKTMRVQGGVWMRAGDFNSLALNRKRILLNWKGGVSLANVKKWVNRALGEIEERR